MDWDFTENIAFKSLIEAFKECDETSATEFLASDGASYYLELIQDAAGAGSAQEPPPRQSNVFRFLVIYC